MADLSHIVNGITDPRRSNAMRHDLHEMLMIALLTVISGGETCTGHSRIRQNQEEIPA